ncbi:MAG: sulfite exporter TauE/SafE family protein [Thermodesulfobacteriota bacterium]
MEGWTLLQLATLGIAGLLAGFVNTLAGGGSLVTLPALLLLGLPADVANATNRVGVLAQSLVAARGLGRAESLPGSQIAWIVVPSLLGSLVGAWVAARLPASVLKPVLVTTLVLIAVTMLWRPEALVPASGATPRDPSARPAALLGLFAIGVYGGFLQAGVGIFLLLFLGGVLRYDLVLGNALKSLLVAALTAVALVVFVVEGEVWWTPGLLLSLTTVLGAQLGVHFALRRGQDAIRKVVFVAVIASCIAAALR